MLIGFKKKTEKRLINLAQADERSFKLCSSSNDFVYFKVLDITTLVSLLEYRGD